MFLMCFISRRNESQEPARYHGKIYKNNNINIGLTLGGGGHFVEEASTPSTVDEALTIDHNGCGVVLTACVHGNWFSYLNR